MKDAVQEQFLTARRNQILDGAAKVFAQKGFHSATVQDVAKEIGMAHGTIYNYFENKTALLFGIFDRMRASIEPDEAALNLDASDFRGFLKIYFQYPLMALKGENFALFRVVISEIMVNAELRERYFQQILKPTLEEGEQILRQWAERHAIKPVNTGLTIRAISSMVLGLTMEYIMGDSLLQEEWEAIPEFLANLFLDGIGAEQS